MSRSRKDILALWLIGVLAAAQLGKFAVLAPELRLQFGLSLPQVGLLISLLEIGGALLGFVAGLAAGIVDARRFLVSGLVTLAATGTVEAFSSDAATLFTARAVEGLGYLLVVVSAPTLIVAVAREEDRTPALALWSSFVAVGMAVGSAITGAADAALGSRGAMLAWSGASLVGLTLAVGVEASPLTGRRTIALPRRAAWLSTLGFGSYTMFASATAGLLPSFLTEQAGTTITAASFATGLASIAALPGSIMAILLLRGRTLDRRRATMIIAPALLTTALLAPVSFVDVVGSPSLSATIIAIIISFLSGVASPIVFGRLPMLAGATHGSDPRVAVANGLVTQFGAGGAWVGPPLGALVVSRWGWSALGMMSCILALTMLILLLLSEASGAKRQTS